MSWRPEGWLPRVFSDAEEESAFEAGADAMLEAVVRWLEENRATEALFWETELGPCLLITKDNWQALREGIEK